MVNINISNMLSKAKKVRNIISSCKDEASFKEGRGEIKKNTANKIKSLLEEIDSHIFHVETVLSKKDSIGEEVKVDVYWFRSLARKLDYYDFENITSSSSLSGAVDDLFVSTIP